jgi:hypothetical protein
VQQEYRRLPSGWLRSPARQMHLETAHPQCLVPRLPQRLVRRYAIQSVQVLQAEAAADQRTNETANHASHGAADTGGAAYLVLRRKLGAVVWLDCPGPGATRRRRWGRGRRVLGFVSV